MASESVTTRPLSTDDAYAACQMLLDAIKAKNELDLIRENIQTAADQDMPAKSLTGLGMMPRPVDLDVHDAAEMVQIIMMSIPREEA